MTVNSASSELQNGQQTMRNFNYILILKKAMIIYLTTSNTNRKVRGLSWCTGNDSFVFDFKNLVILAEDLKLPSEI